MSRFSRKTATGLGYLLFALVGGVGYWIFKSDTTNATAVEMAERPKIDLQIAVGPSIQNATELSAMALQSSFHDPVIDLSQSQSPTWVDHRGMVPIEHLVHRKSAKNLPAEYPYGKVRPMAVPRSGDAIAREGSTTVMSFAPSPQQIVNSLEQAGSSIRPVDPDAIPMVPVNSTNNSSDSNVAEAALETPLLSWHQQSLKALQEIGAAMMAPPPPQSLINFAGNANSRQLVSASKPVVDVEAVASEVTQATSIRPSTNPSWQAPSAVSRQFIVQPSN